MFWMGERNLSDFIPKLKEAEVRKACISTSDKGTTHVGFILNGILITTVDLEIDKAILTVPIADANWIRAKSVIRKGRYLWSIGRVGVHLGGGNIIPFDEPSSDLPVNPGSLHLVDLAPLEGGKSGILITVGGKYIGLK